MPIVVGIQSRLVVVDRPLPPLPSQFRLGEDDLPWTTFEPWHLAYPESESDCASPPPLMWCGNEEEEELADGRREDPQRVRILAELQQAMLTVDNSLSLSQAQSGWTLEISSEEEEEEEEEDVSRRPMPIRLGVSNK
ncbi:hypothetical protein LZ554_003922 [Drepanopeziza brunnea f. sp. 'monogermtubi']|nr:hypothetical protein LZ554_003922 [Drepanopeziza brunnea f. sp. 'monogermtubi']